VSRRSVAPASIALVLGLVLSGCQSIQGVIDNVTGSGSTTTEQNSDQNGEATETTEETTDVPQVEENIEEADPAVPVAAVPTCQEIYSDAQVVAFEEEGRQSEGDISQDGYGYGTTNQELIAILEGVRADLRVSCTWYLPPEFSSTTSISILSTEAMGGVEDILNVAADSQTTLGSGRCGSWNRAAPTSPANTSPTRPTTLPRPSAPPRSPRPTVRCGLPRPTRREALRSSPVTLPPSLAR